MSHQRISLWRVHCAFRRFNFLEEGHEFKYKNFYRSSCVKNTLSIRNQSSMSKASQLIKTPSSITLTSISELILGNKYILGGVCATALLIIIKIIGLGGLIIVVTPLAIYYRKQLPLMWKTLPRDFE